MDELTALAIGVAATITFPVMAVLIHRRRERRRNRKAGVRKTDKIRLTQSSPD